MLKKFIISMLGSIAGVWIAIGIAFLCFFAIVGALVGSDGETKTSIDKHSALYLDLSGSIPERFQPGDIWQMLRQSEEDGEALIDIVNSIRLAANDSKIDGIYIRANGTTSGMATREEIINALRDFKESGKWIVAYGDSYAQGDYLVASCADSLYLNPVGMIDVHGMASRVPFFKQLMDKLGVQMQIVRVGTFKSAVEPFMSEEMSPASRLQTQVMMDSLWNYATSVISAGRGVSTAEINMWADSIMPTWSAAQDLANRSVTSLAYERIVEKHVRALCDLDEDDDLRLVTPSEYMATQKAVDASKEHIAVLFAVGDIVDSGEGGIVAADMVPEIIDLADNEKVGALVLRINSGGGSAYASEQIWEALEYFKSKGKPFYVSMGDYAASGGYYIASGADRIFADRTTLTGSIGVFGMIPDASGLVTDKLGVHFATVATNPDAVIEAPFGAMTAGQKAAFQRSVEEVYDLFTSRVAAGRDMPQDSVKLIAEGRVWTGGAARTLGLVDEIGSLRQTVRAIAEEADIDAERVVFYPGVKDEFLAQVLRQAKGGISLAGATVDAPTLRLLRFMGYLQNMSRIQARMEPVEIY